MTLIKWDYASILLITLASSSSSFQLSQVKQRASFTRLAVNTSPDNEFFSPEKLAKGAAMFLFTMGTAAQISFADTQPAIREPTAPFGEFSFHSSHSTFLAWKGSRWPFLIAERGWETI